MRTNGPQTWVGLEQWAESSRQGPNVGVSLANSRNRKEVGGTGCNGLEGGENGE